MNHRNLPRGSSQGCLELELERILLERIKNIAAMSQGNILLKVASPGSKIHLPEVYANDITVCCQEGSRCSLSSVNGNRNLILRGSSAILSGIAFNGGSLADENGGNLWVRSTGHVEIHNCIFRGGNAVMGGNVHVQDTASLLISKPRNSDPGFCTLGLFS